MTILEKIQNLPDKLKKIILWTILIILAFFLFSFWAKSFKLKIESLSIEKIKTELKLDQLQKTSPKIYPRYEKKE